MCAPKNLPHITFVHTIVPSITIVVLPENKVIYNIDVQFNKNGNSFGYGYSVYLKFEFNTHSHTHTHTHIHTHTHTYIYIWYWVINIRCETKLLMDNGNVMSVTKLIAARWLNQIVMFSIPNYLLGFFISSESALTQSLKT